MGRLVLELHPGLYIEARQNHKRRRGASPSLRQGQLDGACGPYCVWTALILLGSVTFKDINNGRAFRDEKLKPAWQKSLTYFFDGCDESEMAEILTSLKPAIKFGEVSGSMSTVIDYVVARLKKAELIILGYEHRSGRYGHWILVVGLEKLQSGRQNTITAFLCIDPSDAMSSIGLFNARIELKSPDPWDEYLIYRSCDRSNSVEKIILTSAFSLSCRRSSKNER